MGRREPGNLGPVYGYQWRSWPNPDGSSTDQIVKLIEQLKNQSLQPPSRHQCVEPEFHRRDGLASLPLSVSISRGGRQAELSALPAKRGYTFLGVPFNIASYALLTMMVAQVVGLEPGEFVHTFGDVHLYMNHVDQAREQLTREPRPLPQMILNSDVTDLFDFTYDDFELVNYDPHPHIKAAVSV